jgi:DNA-binding GntR family transcriptional regulator
MRKTGRQSGKLRGSVRGKTNSKERAPAKLEDEAAGANTLQLLRVDIIRGSLQPGSRLRFADLHSRYGVGTSPLREALSRLAADRLVMQELNRGFRVPPLSLDDFCDIAKLRRELESAAIRAAVEYGDEKWEEGIILAHHRLRRLGHEEVNPADDAVPEEWESRHRAFHNALIAACRSHWTLHFCSQLHDQFDRYRRWVGRDPDVQTRLSLQHKLLVDATISHDAGRASQILSEHIALTTEMVVKRLRHRPAGR